MKLKLYLCLIISLGFSTVAATQNLEIDQLKKQLKEHPAQDSVRVNRLITMGLDDDLPPGEKEQAATEALLIARKIDYSLGSGYALLNLGDANTQLGKKQEAVALLRQADSIAKLTGDQELTAFVLMRIAANAITTDNKKAIENYLQAETIAQKIGNKKLLAICQRRIGGVYQISFSDYPKAMEYFIKSVNAGEAANCIECLASSWANLGNIYNIIGDQKNSLLYFEKAAAANKATNNIAAGRTVFNNIGERYRLLENYPEALKSYQAALAIENRPFNIELIESNIAEVYTRMDSLPLAFYHGFRSLDAAKKLGDREGQAWINGILSRAYLKKEFADSAIWYAQQGLAAAKEMGTTEFMRDNAAALANAYKFKKDFANAYAYQVLFINYRDSMLNAEITNKSTVLQYNYDLAKKQAEITELDQQRKVQRNFLISSLIVLTLIIATAFLLLRNNRQKQKANRLLQQQKGEIEAQRDQTNKVLKELQQAQKQLIQSEKMASLGELTAGIAHEIQNPLNFVNNFSEVNKELAEELEEEAKNGNLESIRSIAKDIRSNEEKISHHGKRADAIVRGMLQHSRQNRGVEESTDINALCDEYLRLSYHGLRAKDKNFNAELKTDFDAAIQSINVVPQDVGRTLLNIFNNAFYAVNQKKIALEQGAGNTGTYKPLIKVATRRVDNNIHISVEDNGNGITQKILEKIFQPFFTTKPTGQGTGLGLSLAYDTVKAHNGEIKVDSDENIGTTITIILPIK
ncbi:MAG: ATP-binding protein [Bacteroidota bacterium]